MPHHRCSSSSARRKKKYVISLSVPFFAVCVPDKPSVKAAAIEPDNRSQCTVCGAKERLLSVRRTENTARASTSAQMKLTNKFLHRTTRQSKHV